MFCPECKKGETKVIDSREDEQSIRRRRECLKCEFRFTTFERIEVANLMVIKRDGSKQPFARDKIVAGILKAGKKRSHVLEQAELIAQEIERDLHAECRGEVTSSQIGKQVLGALKSIDSIAYLRFASVHRSFNDLVTFEKELASILTEAKS